MGILMIGKEENTFKDESLLVFAALADFVNRY